MMKSDTPVKDLHHFMEREVGAFVHDLERYMRAVEKIEQTYNKKGGI